MDKDNNRPGIYAIVNIENNHKYIGQAKNLAVRWRQHKNQLERGVHCNQYLQHAYDKYGKVFFTYSVLEYLDDDLKHNLNEREQYWIDKLRPEYNLIEYADNNVEYKFIRKNFIINVNDVLVLKHWQKYKAPAWNHWVYGFGRNPAIYGSRPSKKGA